MSVPTNVTNDPGRHPAVGRLHDRRRPFGAAQRLADVRDEDAEGKDGRRADGDDADDAVEEPLDVGEAGRRVRVVPAVRAVAVQGVDVRGVSVRLVAHGVLDRARVVRGESGVRGAPRGRFAARA